jgi:formate-dependent nitrite reductase membrane component NrfD
VIFDELLLRPAAFAGFPARLGVLWLGVLWLGVLWLGVSLPLCLCVSKTTVVSKNTVV